MRFERGNSSLVDKSLRAAADLASSMANRNVTVLRAAPAAT